MIFSFFWKLIINSFSLFDDFSLKRLKFLLLKINNLQKTCKLGNFFTFFCFQVFISLQNKIRQDMKDTILEKSKELFLRNGFKTVGMDDIAQSLHISKKTIYQYFPSKDDLVKAVLSYIYDLAFGKIEEISGKCETAIHEHFKIKESIDGILGKDFETSPCFFQLKKYYPELCYDFEKRRCKDVKTHIKKNISEGIKQGVYRENLDKTFLAVQFIAGSDAIDLYEAFPEEIGKSISIKEHDNKFLEFYLRSIVTPKGLEIVENLIKNENEV